MRISGKTVASVMRRYNRIDQFVSFADVVYDFLMGRLVKLHVRAERHRNEAIADRQSVIRVMSNEIRLLNNLGEDYEF